MGAVLRNSCLGHAASFCRVGGPSLVLAESPVVAALCHSSLRHVAGFVQFGSPSQFLAVGVLCVLSNLSRLQLLAFVGCVVPRQT